MGWLELLQKRFKLKLNTQKGRADCGQPTSSRFCLACGWVPSIPRHERRCIRQDEVKLVGADADEDDKPLVCLRSRRSLIARQLPSACWAMAPTKTKGRRRSLNPRFSGRWRSATWIRGRGGARGTSPGVWTGMRARAQTASRFSSHASRRAACRGGRLASVGEEEHGSPGLFQERGRPSGRRWLTAVDGPRQAIRVSKSSKSSNRNRDGIPDQRSEA